MGSEGELDGFLIKSYCEYYYILYVNMCTPPPSAINIDASMDY